MSELALHIELVVETFARKIAALAIDAVEQKQRAERAEAEVERLRREYEPGYKPGAPTETPVSMRNMRAWYEQARAELAAEKKRAQEVHESQLRHAEARDVDLAEMRTALAAANETIERLTTLANNERAAWEVAVNAHAATSAQLATAKAEIALLRDERDEARDHEMRAKEALGATSVKLGRAVEMVNVLANHLESAADVIADCDVLEPEDEEDQEVRDLIAAARTLAADADGTQAAAYVSELEAVYEAGKRMREIHFAGDDAAAAWGALDEALAAVDARRGQGGGR